MSTVHDPQLLKGVLSLLLLRLLAERESYGYELVQWLRELGLSGLAEGTVYPALARLEREGRLLTRLVPSRSGPARKYYRPSDEGYQALTHGTASWQEFVDIVTPVLKGDPPAEPDAPVAPRDAQP